MRVISIYSHKNGESVIRKHWHNELEEIFNIISAIDAESLRTKKSKEKTMRRRMLYSPKALNKAFKAEFAKLGWEKARIQMVTSVELSAKIPPDIIAKYTTTHKGFREIDFTKNKLGVEVQFGKYAFMVYNVLAKMTVFHNRECIDAGVEIVPMRRMTAKGQMSTGVSYFEQMKGDLETRGIADLDIPVIVLGIDSDSPP